MGIPVSKELLELMAKVCARRILHTPLEDHDSIDSVRAPWLYILRATSWGEAVNQFSGQAAERLLAMTGRGVSQLNKDSSTASVHSSSHRFLIAPLLYIGVQPNED